MQRISETRPSKVPLRNRRALQFICIKPLADQRFHHLSRIRLMPRAITLKRLQQNRVKAVSPFDRLELFPIPDRLNRFFGSRHSRASYNLPGGNAKLPVISSDLQMRGEQLS